MKRYTVVGAVLVFVATGCATVPRTTQGPCLPPGIATDVFLWPVVETGALGFLPVEGGGTARIVYVLYERADRRVAIGWVGGRILIVDPEPSATAPPWFNDALIVGGREIRTTPASACRWKRATDTQA
jgi:hypothetical protein